MRRHDEEAVEVGKLAADWYVCRICGKRIYKGDPTCVIEDGSGEKNIICRECCVREGYA